MVIEIRMITRVPSTKRVFGDIRNRTGNGGEILQSLLVVEAMAKEVEINIFGILTETIFKRTYGAMREKKEARYRQSTSTRDHR